jgi:quercetin dioxygenase-like cupin family protein
MKSLTHLMIGVLLVTLVLVFTRETTMAQDPTKVAPNNYKVLLENDRVRVLEYQDKPGDKVAMHAHPAYLAYILSPGKVKFTSPEGKTTEVEQQSGQVQWLEAETHAVENAGTTDTRVLIIELKK